MNDVDKKPRPRWRPRFSLLAALWLMTIIGLVIVVVQLWLELVPLRSEVRRYRNELGHLTIDDPTRIHGIQVPSREASWKWRLYFPPGGKYQLHCYTGMIPAGVSARERRDFQSMNPGPGGYSQSFGGIFDGEVFVEARFKETDGKSTLEISFDGGGWSRLRLDEEFAESLADPRGGGFSTSNFNSNEQDGFAPDERVFLLKKRRPIIKELPGGVITSRDPNGPAPGVALWIEAE